MLVVITSLLSVPPFRSTGAGLHRKEKESCFLLSFLSKSALAVSGDWLTTGRLFPQIRSDVLVDNLVKRRYSFYINTKYMVQLMLFSELFRHGKSCHQTMATRKGGVLLRRRGDKARCVCVCGGGYKYIVMRWPCQHSNQSPLRQIGPFGGHFGNTVKSPRRADLSKRTGTMNGQTLAWMWQWT